MFVDDILCRPDDVVLHEGHHAVRGSSGEWLGITMSLD